MAQGALMSLVAYGAQDVYLTGNPQITHFKVVYRRHTNFALETIELPMNSSCNFGGRSCVTISRNGDLIANIYLQVKLDKVCPSVGSKFAWVRRVGHALIKDVSVTIGGSTIDKQYGVWLNIWYDLAHHAGDGERGFLRMIGDVHELTTYDDRSKCEYTLYIPLQFWFNRHYGLALPLIALQYHEVKLDFSFAERKDVVVANRCFKDRDMSQICMKDTSVLVKYVFLDSEERRRFAQVGHEYLIEQVQFTGEESFANNTGKFRLDFNHPTKELIWVVKNDNYTSGKAFPFYTGSDNWECELDDMARAIVAASVLTTDCDACTPTTAAVGYGALAAGDVLAEVTNGTCKKECLSSGSSNECFDPNEACGIDDWVEVEPTIGDTNKKCVSKNGAKWTVINESGLSDGCCKSIWVNLCSLKVDQGVVKCSSTDDADLALTSNIYSATVRLNECCEIIVCDIQHNLTVRMASYPTDCLRDTRNQDQVDDACVVQLNNFGTLIDGSVNPVDTAKLQINGHDREETRNGYYFNYLQPDQHHTNTPADGINVYSFALYPELHQPSGTTNLSRIDNTQLCVTLADKTKGCNERLPELCRGDRRICVFAFSYNVLRIMSGMGGLAYSN